VYDDGQAPLTTRRPEADCMPEPLTVLPGRTSQQAPLSDESSDRLRIGINLLFLIPGVVGGTQTYAAGLLRGLADVAAHDEYILFLNRECSELTLPDAANFRRVVCPVNAVRRGVRYSWEQLALPNVVRRHRVQVLHSLGYVGPVRAPSPHVISVHDMNVADIPESFSLLRRMAFGSVLAYAARRADRLITMSEFAKSRIIHHLRIAPERIMVIHHASREPTVACDIARRYHITRPYIVAFSSPFPQKNIPRLVEAFAVIAAEVPHDLVLIGHLPADDVIPRTALNAGVSDRVVLTGYVPDADLMPLLSGADLFAFPSRYEGFGIPLLEAQRAGVPVVCSNAASVPEVAGDGALFFNPYVTQDIALAMRRVLGDGHLARELVRRGAENVRRFSWRRTALATRRVYAELAC
jgi:glycosyltransferase involved in cell wall biosynthesis